MTPTRGKPPDPDEAAARLIERVLSDSAFRARFRRDPAAAAREAGLEPVEEPTTDRALETLEIRESKSSLAGAMLAAAVEGIALYDFADHSGALSGIGLGVEDAAAAVPQSASPQALALLDNRDVAFDPDGVADLRAGRIDERIVAVLGEVAKHHTITVSSMLSDHPDLTAGGSVSNHHFGRAVDIAMVDGSPVSPGNAAAREVAAELLRLDPSIRPTELGSPWALGDPVAFTDGDHQDHIHVAFDDPARPGQAPPPAVVDDAVGDDDTDGDDADQTDSEETDDQDDEDDDDADEDEDDEEDDGGDDDADEDDDGDDDEDEDEDDAEDEDEPDEDEPDEDEPDEVGPDEDDLTDDERVEGGDESDDDSDSDSDDDGDQADGDDQADSDDSDSDDTETDLSEIGSDYPGDTAPREQVALWMAAEAQRRGLPPELPVMAALVESGMRNLPGGDADSMGFFQMRAGIWNSGPYAGYGSRPRLQLDWFLDHAESVRAQRLARGLPITDPKHYGDWIADVERPAEQYRGRYQLQLDEARELLRHGPPAEELVGAVSGSSLEAGSRAQAAVAEAERYLGTPYRWGGSTPQTGFDCSGLVQWAYGKAGIRIPRVTDQQIMAPGATKVDRDRLLPGDLVFFRDDSGYVHHVGMSLGGKKFIHAPHTGDQVKISSLNEAYYAQHFTGGRRFDPALEDNRARVMAAIRPDQVTRPRR